MIRHAVLTASVLVLAAWVVAACDFGEERPFNYKKGEYLGPSHQPLDEPTLEALKARAGYQGMLGAPSLASGPSSVRPPGASR